MLWSDTAAMLTARRRASISLVEQQPVDTTDPEHPKNGRGRVPRDELAADAGCVSRRVHEAVDPGRVQERETSEVQHDRVRPRLQDLSEEPTQGLDGREIEIALEADHDVRLNVRDRPTQDLGGFGYDSWGTGVVHQQKLYAWDHNLVNPSAKVEQICVSPSDPGHNRP